MVEAEAEPAQRGQQLGGRDYAVAIAVEQVEDAAQALGLEPPLPAAVAGRRCRALGVASAATSLAELTTPPHWQKART